MDKFSGDRLAEVAVVFDVIVVGGGPAGLSAAMMLGRCRRRVLLCDDKPRNRHSHALHAYLTRDGIKPAELNALGRAELDKYGVECRSVSVAGAVRRDRAFKVEAITDRVTKCMHIDGVLASVEFAGRTSLPFDAIFFTTGQHPRCDLAHNLGCAFNRKGTVDTGTLNDTNVPGVFVAGDASRDAQFVIVAAAEGVKAALAINQALQREDLRP